MGCIKWFLLILLILAVLAGIAYLVMHFGGVVLWVVFGVLLAAGIVLGMTAVKN